ncbi:MAG: ChaN family lipoprotein [Hyphomicrobiaceae bacterium]
MRRILLVLAFALAALSPATADGIVPAGGWRSSEARAHPLVGRIVDTATGAALAPEALRQRIASHAIVLIGEVHDNADHHLLQAEMIAGKAAAVFEHLRADQQPALDALETARVDGKPLPAAGELLERLAWSTSGWPDASLFAPLFAAALAQRSAIVSGDPARATIRDIARSGLGGIVPRDRVRLGLGQSLGEVREARLLDELEASHCGLMPRAAFATMAAAQRYRDAHLADRLAGAFAAHGSAALLAGNGHVRKDRGVPWYLARRHPPVPALVVSLVELQDDRTDLGDYVERGPEGTPTADIVVLTPRAARPDPCEEMRRAFAPRR